MKNRTLQQMWNRTKAKGLPLIIAHRGYSGKAPENTLTAFRLALEAGVDMVELDVQLSRDQEVVVFHDRTVNRTTDGKGAIHDLTLRELKSLDAGSWFHRKFSGERIPTLREVLEFLNHQIGINIEMKANSRSQHWSEQLESKVVHIIKEHGIENNVVLSSFDHRIIKRIKHAHPELVTAVLYRTIKDFGKRPSKLVASAHANAFVCSRWRATRRIIDDAHRHDIPIFVYTINTQWELEKMMRYGVQGIITNFPEIARNLR